MSDAGFVVIFMSILLGILCWYVFKIIVISDKYYGENSFVKVPTIFEVHFINTIGFFTFLYVFNAFMGLFLLANIIINPISDFLAKILIIIVSLGLVLLSVFEFY